MTARRLLVLVQLPLPGLVKTRIAARLGDDNAVQLYDAMVQDQLEAMATAGFPLTLCHSPIAPLDAYRDWLGRDRSFQLQEGDDLGDRMRHAFETAFAKGAEQVVLVGSDLPEITPELLQAAFAALDREEAVLAPSDDGGYTLIGFSRERFQPTAFTDIPWSSPQVLAASLAALERAGQAVHLLPTLPDLDTADDLAALLRRHTSGGPRRTLTLASRLDLDG
ncbi:MAG: TIGR04282 family arsenosugar biosynthesis glycosyltransferase [Proteobacteria bacterium]|nr:TIGR04282 family arsenosugar biosynthesis glycosyltransferase [Pseudomonadota bacterium]